MLRFRYVFTILLITLLVVPLWGVWYTVSAQSDNPAPPAPPFREPASTTSQNDVSIVHKGSNILDTNPEAINSSFLEPGDNYVHGLVYAYGNLWASTRTSPPRIIKIDPVTLDVLDRITLTGTFPLDGGEDIEAAGGYLWVIRYSDPAQLVRVDPDTMAYEIFNLTGADYLSYGAALEYAFGYLWVGGYNRLARVEVSSNPPDIITYDYSGLATNGGVLHTLTSSSDRLWAGYYQCSNTACDSFVAQIIMVVDPASPGMPENTVDLGTEFFPDDITYVGLHMFASTENDPGDPSDVYRFADGLTYTHSFAFDQISFGTFKNPLDPLAFWAAYDTTPGRIIRFDHSLDKLNSIALPTGYNSPSEIVFDLQGNMYVSTWQSPSGIVKYDEPTADAGEDQTVVDGDGSGAEEVVLDGSGSYGTIASYVWSEGGDQIATGVKPVVSFAVGTHTVTLEVTDNDGLSDTDIVIITVEEGVNGAPTANAGPDQIVVDGDGSGAEEVVLDGSGSSDSDGTIASYVWSEGGIQIAAVANPLVSFAVGTHTVTLEVTDNDGLSDTDTVIITVEEGVNGAPTANAGPDQIVVDSNRSGAEEVMLDGSGSSDSDGTIVSYVWSEGGNQIATGVNPIVSFAVGTHTVMLQVTDDDGLSDTDIVIITISADNPTLYLPIVLRGGD